MGNPVRGLLERGRLEPAAAHAAILASVNQACPLEHLDVFQDGRQRHGERAGQLGDRRVRLGQARQDRPARPVGQRAERRIQAGLIVNHMVNL